MGKRRGIYARRILGRNVRRLRKERKMNQEELGDAASLTQSQISSIERAKLNVRLDKLQDLAMALGARLADMLDDKKS
jgi:transcriptional regulator with XRE-family HTH domain